MFSIKKLIVLGVIAVLPAGLPADAKTAKTATQTANKPNKPNKPGGYGVSTTTGWRKIDGWQKTVTDRDPNLQHWSWLGMQEMQKSYIRLRPGQRDNSRPSRYVKPIHESVYRPHVAHYMSGGSAPRGGVYNRPVSVPLPTREQVAANARLNAPKTSVSWAVPRTNPVLAVPIATPRLATRSTSVRLAAPATSVRLAAPETRAQLASANTHIRLTTPPVQKKPQQDAMSDCGSNYSDDSFESPDTESNPYGVRRHNYGYSKTAVNVKGKVVRKRH